jgi:uncharacterized protein YcbX
LKQLTGDEIQVTIWDDRCAALLMPQEISEWFTHHLSFSCRLVFMPDSSRRIVDPELRNRWRHHGLS